MIMLLIGVSAGFVFGMVVMGILSVDKCYTCGGAK